jgi:very-short-patch-repair endonuclease
VIPQRWIVSADNLFLGPFPPCGGRTGRGVLFYCAASFGTKGLPLTSIKNIFSSSVKMQNTLLRNARHLRKNLTDAERKLWLILRRRYIENFRFRKQVPMGNYICDFVCHEARLIIEIDGGQHADNVKYDNQRTLWLEQQGYRVLRFWNSEVLTNFDSVAEVIFRELTNPPSCPSPTRGEGT